MIASILLIIGSAFFVAAEYGLVGARRPRLEALAKRGNRSASLVLKELDRLSFYIAGIQILITMIGIGLGAITEPQVTAWLKSQFGSSVGAFAGAISILVVTFAVVIIGELVPKYVSLKYADRVALLVIRPLRFTMLVLQPLVWVVQQCGRLALKPFGIDPERGDSDQMSKEELFLLVRSGTSEGTIDHLHAQVLNKALKFDELDANDVMIHRLDVKWIDVDTPRSELFAHISSHGHSRIPVCRGDVDDMIGLLYVHDVIRHWDDPDFNLEKILRPVEVVPESLTLNKVLNRMREVKTHILIVVDEYGGTSGLITLEDLVEEIFGELDDQNESDRPAIERLDGGRLTVRSDVRFDEIAEFLNLELHPEESTTDSVAEIIVRELDRMPKLGDAVETALGLLRVENMARRRITRVRVHPKRDPVIGDS